MKAIDDYLGKSVYLAGTEMTIIGRDPVKGWRIAGPGVMPTWIPDFLWHALWHRDLLRWVQ